MSSNREEQEEKLRVLLNDVRRDKHQHDTMHQRAIVEMGQEYQGRFSKLRAEQQIIGTTPIAYPQLPQSSPWSSPLPCEEPLIDATDCSDTYIGEPLGTPAEIEATSAPSTPCAQTGRRGSHALASPPVEERPASPGGVSNQPNFRRRI